MVTEENNTPGINSNLFTMTFGVEGYNNFQKAMEDHIEQLKLHPQIQNMSSGLHTQMDAVDAITYGIGETARIGINYSNFDLEALTDFVTDLSSSKEDVQEEVKSTTFSKEHLERLRKTINKLANG